MKSIELQSVVYKEGKYYVAQCLGIDVSSFGKTVKEALANLTEAVELYLEDQHVAAIETVQDPQVHTLHLEHA